jgi:hypothetical protein
MASWVKHKSSHMFLIKEARTYLQEQRVEIRILYNTYTVSRLFALDEDLLQYKGMYTYAIHIPHDYIIHIHLPHPRDRIISTFHSTRLDYTYPHYKR